MTASLTKSKGVGLAYTFFFFLSNFQSSEFYFLLHTALPFWTFVDVLIRWKLKSRNWFERDPWTGEHHECQGSFLSFCTMTIEFFPLLLIESLYYLLHIVIWFLTFLFPVVALVFCSRCTHVLVNLFLQSSFHFRLWRSNFTSRWISNIPCLPI